MSVTTESMYQEIILDHYRNPHHRGLQESFDSTENLDYVHGQARLVGDPDGREHRVLVTLDDGSETELTTGEVYLNVGNRAAIPPIDGLEHVPYLTEVELLALSELPTHLVIVGGGYIGLEFGQMFQRFGSQVTVVAGGGVAPREDEDVSALVEELHESPIGGKRPLQPFSG